MGDELKGVGTRKSGYATPKDGPFRCGNCVHFHGDSGNSMKAGGWGECDHPEVYADQQVDRIGAHAAVQAQGCCNYFRPQKVNIGALVNSGDKGK
jgi:hypothetical protein